MSLGNCPECHQENVDIDWCQQCNARHFQEEFYDWTSGSREIDEVIQRLQLSAQCSPAVVEWIPYNSLFNVESMARTGFGDIFKGEWMAGYIEKWSAELYDKGWKRSGPTRIVLKRISKGDNPDVNLNELVIMSHLAGKQGFSMRCFGITRNPDTLEYLLVIPHHPDGDLRHFYRQNFAEVTWDQRLGYLLDIARNLQIIHQEGYIYTDLHPGSILISKDKAIISDFAHIKIVTEPERESVTGAIPYVAPEVLQGNPYTQAADMYSFSMIMWELTSGKVPHNRRQHDVSLVVDICQGLRPTPIDRTPDFYVELMERCWDPDPLKRPTAGYVYDVLNPLTYTPEIEAQIKLAEEIRKQGPPFIFQDEADDQEDKIFDDSEIEQ